MPQVSTLSYTLSNAFTNRVNAGNPAATVILPEDHGLATAELHTIATNFNQPITTFVILPKAGTTSSSNVAKFGIRWFTPEGPEVEVCGHGTASGVIFAAGAKYLALGVDLLEYTTTAGKLVTACETSDGLIEIKLPAAPLAEVTGEERGRLAVIFARSVGAEPSVVRYIGKPIEGYGNYILVELEANVLLGDRIVDTHILTATEFLVNVFTSATPEGLLDFHSRMFAPRVGLNEDHVCGSAHTLLTPYWTLKHGKSGQMLKTKQVNARGGDLVVFWDEENKVVKLQGECRIFAQGDYNLS